jgi:hypothetical protein
MAVAGVMVGSRAVAGLAAGVGLSSTVTTRTVGSAVGPATAGAPQAAKTAHIIAAQHKTARREIKRLEFSRGIS